MKPQLFHRCGVEGTFEDAKHGFPLAGLEASLLRAAVRRRRRLLPKKGASSANGEAEEPTEVTEAAAETEVMEAPDRRSC